MSPPSLMLLPALCQQHMKVALLFPGEFLIVYHFEGAHPSFLAGVDFSWRTTLTPYLSMDTCLASFSGFIVQTSNEAFFVQAARKVTTLHRVGSLSSVHPPSCNFLESSTLQAVIISS